MKTHTLHTRFVLDRPLGEVFPFFADAGNLAHITPPELGFEILSRQPIEMKLGATIDYRIRLHGLPMHWESVITRWEPGACFVDEQRRGPYASWIHTHRFHEEAGATVIEDDVRYELPLWPLGELALPLVRRQLGRIFTHREAATRRLLP